MLSAVTALLGALVYGGSDFLGGLAAKRMRAEKVTAINSIAGLAVVLVASLFLGADYSPEAIGWGIAAGTVGAAALALLYACLALGPMAILAPIMALVSAIVPVAIGFVRGERLSGFGYLGIAVGLLAILLICFVPGAGAVRPSTRGIVMAVGAGAAVGLYISFIDLSPADSGVAPLVVVFLVAGVLTWSVVAVRRLTVGRREVARRGGVSPSDTDDDAAQRPVWWRAPASLAAYSGLTDALASVLFLLALRLGTLSVVSVLSALSPAGTILLAAVVLRERVAVVQWVGLAVALVAAALLALA